jgi:L-2-hydroxyglutarate oxidase LhgO
MEKVDIVIVGAGVVGLAVARELSFKNKDIFVLERNHAFGQETSSRNSEVIHAGLYYSKESLKTKTCIEGRRMLYDFCARFNIPHKKIGKLVVAVDESEVGDLEGLMHNARDNGVEGLEILSRKEIKDIEPAVEAEAALYSPETGIIDSHSFMKSLLDQFGANLGEVAYLSDLAGAKKIRDGFELSVDNKSDGVFKFETRLLINCAGLNSDKVSALVGLAKDDYRIYYCKGDYFRVKPSKAGQVKHLVYPVPKPKRAGLGIHATLDLAGGMRLGPDDEYVNQLNYDIDPGKSAAFAKSVATFMPFIENDDLTPDTSGIRPKLQGPGQSFRDFIIRDESDNGFPGLINLIGIESPGLTAALSIAKMVGKIAGNYT